MSNSNLITIDHLHIYFNHNNQRINAVNDISFSIAAGETYSLVGESGSGKTLSALATVKLLPSNAQYHGNILFQDTNIFTATNPQLRHIRSVKTGFIFQEPMSALNPLHPVGKQIGEVLKLQLGLTAKEVSLRVYELLDLVQIKEPEKKILAYPHELSGGQRQRVMIAMALACQPKLLIADEPTTALDACVQGEILRLIKQLQKKLDMAMLFISHDLNIVRSISDRIGIMKNGKMIEQKETEQLFTQPQEAYSIDLLNSIPKNKVLPKPLEQNILNCQNLSVWFLKKQGLLFRKKQFTKAVNQINITLKKRETLGILGESGSGKSTLALALLGLVNRHSGSITFLNHTIDTVNYPQALRKDIQIVFQDPYGSLSPRMTVAEIILEGIHIHHPNWEKQKKLELLLTIINDVQLDPNDQYRYPHEFSGGQRQRIAIARAIILKPKLIVLDEPTSALDRTVQKKILDLLKSLQLKYCLSYLFISHDLSVVRSMSHRIMIMKEGNMIEQGTTEQIFTKPKQLYTQDLLKHAFLT